MKNNHFTGWIKKNTLQIQKMFDKLEPGKKISGFIVGNKVNPYHFFKGWMLAIHFEFSNKEEFMNFYNSALSYLEPEMGNRMAIYFKIPRKLEIPPAPVNDPSISTVL